MSVQVIFSIHTLRAVKVVVFIMLIVHIKCSKTKTSWDHFALKPSECASLSALQQNLLQFSTESASVRCWFRPNVTSFKVCQEAPIMCSLKRDAHFIFDSVDHSMSGWQKFHQSLAKPLNMINFEWKKTTIRPKYVHLKTKRRMLVTPALQGKTFENALINN